MKDNFLILDRIEGPADLRKLDHARLPQLADELRRYVLDCGKGKSGHVRSSLAVTELSLALHYHFNTPEDILIWDVGHQSYVHKILTGRRKDFENIRQFKSISGFTSSSESPFDPFGAGHSSTALSALAGYAFADAQSGAKRKKVAVIGDGGLTGGMAFEALNFLGERKEDVLLVLNDNGRSIDKNVGALHHHGRYDQFFRALGWAYHGSIDGNELNALLPALGAIDEQGGPRVLHLKTALPPLPEVSASSKAITFQSALADMLAKKLWEVEKLHLLSPAMLSGAGFTGLKENFPARVNDVGIAEQHAVTMAAGMAAAGALPLCHLYSTFAQRAADQIIHDVALQNLPVFFVFDRAGLVGADGATHHGVFDVALFSGVPNLEIYNPATAGEMQLILDSYFERPRPLIMRIPKANLPETGFEAGALKHTELKPLGQRLLISTGLLSAEIHRQNLPAGWAHWHLNQLRPFDYGHLAKRLSTFEKILTVEEQVASGGMGEKIAALLAAERLNVKLRCLSLPDRFIQHGLREALLDEAGISPAKLQAELLRD